MEIDVEDKIEEEIQEEEIAEEKPDQNIPEDTEPDQQPSTKMELRDWKKLQAPKRYGFNEFAAVTVSQEEPQSVDKALQLPEWKKAMFQELESLRKHEVWEMTELPSGKQPLKCCWVYRIKYDKYGNVERYKAHLVICGYSQKEGIDYQETFSPVVRFDSIRSILSIAAKQNMTLEQFDVTTAFLYANLDEEIYMLQPPGFEDGSSRVCMLKKSLYGLKQAPRQWNKRFSTFLKTFGLEATDADSCVFINKERDLILAIYVDDGLIASRNQQKAQKLKKALQKEFEIQVGPLSHYLGMDVEKKKDGSIFIGQKSYAKQVLKKFQMWDAEPVSIPMDMNQQLSSELHKSQEIKSVPYREVIGSLLFLANVSQPDISFAVNKVSQYVEKPRLNHWKAVKKILKYVKGTIDHGITYHTGGSDLHGFSDADYAGDIADRKSTTGYVFINADGAISWASRKQEVVALSTMESEYIAGCTAAQEATWLRLLFQELEGERRSVPLYIDNASALQYIKNPGFHKRTKHIDVRYHFVCQKEMDGTIKSTKVCGDRNLADMFTKALPSVRLGKLKTACGLKATV